MGIKSLAIGIAVLMLVVTIELVRREKLTFKYAFGWMLISLLAIVSVLFDNLLFQLAYWLGFVLPSNFIFFTLLAAFVFLSLFLTVFLCQQDVRNDIMAQKIGILEMEVAQLRKEQDGRAPEKGRHG